MGGCCLLAHKHNINKIIYLLTLAILAKTAETLGSFSTLYCYMFAFSLVFSDCDQPSRKRLMLTGLLESCHHSRVHLNQWIDPSLDIKTWTVVQGTAAGQPCLNSTLHINVFFFGPQTQRTVNNTTVTWWRFFFFFLQVIHIQDVVKLTERGCCQ